jgi:hypothetical protein
LCAATRSRGPGTPVRCRYTYVTARTVVDRHRAVTEQATKSEPANEKKKRGRGGREARETQRASESERERARARESERERERARARERARVNPTRASSDTEAIACRVRVGLTRASTDTCKHRHCLHVQAPTRASPTRASTNTCLRGLFLIKPLVITLRVSGGLPPPPPPPPSPTAPPSTAPRPRTQLLRILTFSCPICTSRAPLARTSLAPLARPSSVTLGWEIIRGEIFLCPCPSMAAFAPPTGGWHSHLLLVFLLLQLLNTIKDVGFRVRV